MKNYISEKVHKKLSKILEVMEARGCRTKLERNSFNILQLIYNEWEYIQNKR